jgi:hypothetical protein
MPGLAKAIDQVIARGERELRDAGSGAGLVEEVPQLRALQLFTYAARVPPGTVHSRHDFRIAGLLARKAGHEQAAGILEYFAVLVDNDGTRGFTWDHNFDGDVEPYHRRWAARHRALAAFGDIDLARLPPGPVREHGRTWRGADGAACTRAVCEGLPGGPFPAVIVRTSAARAEVVAFGTDRAADGWLASRSVVGTGPLPTTADGPACRAVREDEILARLLRDPGSGTLRALASENTWTSHLRAELFGALRRRRDGAIPDATAVRLQYQHSLERAPGWALREIGWPHAHRAMRYLDRLLATEVTEGQAVAAAQALTAAGPAPALTVTGIPAPQARAPHPAGRSRDLSAAVPLARAATARRIILQPPALPSSDGLIPRR